MNWQFPAKPSEKIGGDIDHVFAFVKSSYGKVFVGKMPIKDPGSLSQGFIVLQVSCNLIYEQVHFIVLLFSCGLCLQIFESVGNFAETKPLACLLCLKLSDYVLC